MASAMRGGYDVPSPAKAMRKAKKPTRGACYRMTIEATENGGFIVSKDYKDRNGERYYGPDSEAKMAFEDLAGVSAEIAKSLGKLE